MPRALTARIARVVPNRQVVATLLNAHQSRSAQLGALYADADGARKEELASMTQRSAEGSMAPVFTTFYNQLRSVREYHRKFPSAPSTESAETTLIAAVLEAAPEVGFTGEEAEGRYVDMHALHEAYLNLKGCERIDYCTYLKQCSHLAALPKTTATSGAYARYSRELRDYLLGFLRRTQPLMPLNKLIEAAEADFEQRWQNGAVTRWQSSPPTEAAPAPAAVAASSATLDLGTYDSAAALEALGLEVLKHELTRRGLKCGGTLQQRAERLYLAKTTPLAAMPKIHLAKPTPPPAPHANGAASGTGSASDGSAAGLADGSDAAGTAAAARGARAVALLEELVARLGELLADVLEESAMMVEKKQARTYDEIERDLMLAAQEDAMEVDEDEDEDAEEKPIYNPLNLPLGWDGKPIPYWLYKLHGLNLEFKCEICGNYSYWGPRPFERHFQEWRHAYGMKCLGIPNSKPFQGITLIEDAYTLWAKLKAEKGTTAFQADTEEEFEDGSGNVMTRKVYTDLARQGLLD